MSELKAINLNSMGCYNINEPVYLKSEADKVIAELEEKLDIYKRGWMENDRVNANQYAEILHHKYKRCMAMADKCVDLCHKAKDLYRLAEDENLEHYYNHKIEFFARWHKRWLKLAEKFKPNN